MVSLKPAKYLCFDVAFVNVRCYTNIWLIVIIFMLISVEWGVPTLYYYVSLTGGDMTVAKIVDVVEELALPVADELNYEIVDVEYKKEGARWILRYYIDKDGGVSLDDCQLFSQKVS